MAAPRCGMRDIESVEEEEANPLDEELQALNAADAVDAADAGHRRRGKRYAIEGHYLHLA